MIPRPSNRLAERLAKNVELAIESLEQTGVSEDRDATRGKLDRERKSIEPAYDLALRRATFVATSGERRQERHGIVVFEHAELVDRLVPESLSRREDDTRRGRARKSKEPRLCHGFELLDVVDDDEAPRPSRASEDVAPDLVSTRHRASDAKRDRKGRCGIGDGVHTAHLDPERRAPTRVCASQRGLADAAGAPNRHRAFAREDERQSSELTAAADERGRHAQNLLPSSILRISNRL